MLDCAVFRVMPTELDIVQVSNCESKHSNPHFNSIQKWRKDVQYIDITLLQYDRGNTLNLILLSNVGVYN